MPRHPSPPPPPPGPVAAVVCTVKDWSALGDSWCTYHLAIGFAHLYVYFDDPRELAQLGLSERFPAERLTAVPHDARLRAAWAQMAGASELLPHADAEVQIRQQLNARHAMGLAVQRGVNWLLHIDADELFDPGASAADAPSHFARLDECGIDTFCYMNHEAVPEATSVVDPFREVTLFKRCLELVERSDAARRAVDLWQSRHEGCYFYYYDNGKAAVRVSAGARPLSVHEWLPGTPEAMQTGWYSNLRDQWAERGELGRFVKYMPSEACILHYPVYSVDALWTRYHRRNINYTLGGRLNPPPFHETVCLAAQAAHEKGGRDAARDTVRRLFEQKVMLSDVSDVKLQLRSGVCARFSRPSSILCAGRDR